MTGEKKMNAGNDWELAGTWYKGALHVHTTASDGCLNVPAVCEQYRRHGFDFVCITDHWRRFAHTAQTRGDDMLIIEGIELDGCDDRGVYYHVVAIGGDDPQPMPSEFSKALYKMKNQGALLFWAHPHWTGNRLEDGLAHPFDGLEIYTHAAHCEIGKGIAGIYWDAILEEKPCFLGVAVDDAHFRPEDPFFNGGWVVVNAENRTRDAVLAALQQGRFYASRGPAFHHLKRRGDCIELKTSPVVAARIVGPRSTGRWRYAAAAFTETVFELDPAWAYVRLEIEDAAGRAAWTQNLHCSG